MNGLAVASIRAVVIGAKTTPVMSSMRRVVSHDPEHLRE
jgi:hypothetical protein